MSLPTRKQVQDWRHRLSGLVQEMEYVYGDTMDNYPPAVQMATWLAFHAAVEEENTVERVQRSRGIGSDIF